MKPLLTSQDIHEASKKLKNNKATRPDGVHAKYLKYGSNQLFVNISEILNKTSETGEYPENIRLGTFNPLAKPPKKNEKVNERPSFYYHH